MSKRSLPTTTPEEHPQKKHQPNHITSSCSIFNITSSWSSADIQTDLPPLPPILDPKLERQAFTHSGVSGELNYERLEWLGDILIELIATRFIYNTFQDMPIGRCSQIREQLVCNEQLAKFYRQYNLASRTRLPQDMGSMSDLIESKPRDRRIIKIQGDIFEAYVAAVISSDPQNGEANVANWLKILWATTIKDAILREERAREEKERHQSNGQANPTAIATTPPEAPAKERLANQIMVKGIRIRYEDLPKSGEKKDKYTGLPLYIVGVYLDGWGEQNKLLGMGSALSKKEAGQKAAVQALENKKLMKKYGNQKLAYQQAQKDAEKLGEEKT